MIYLDWTQCTDESTGHPYYWNIVTKEVTWEMPIEYQHFLEYSLAQNANSLKKWTLCYTDDGASYYFNAATREISWKEPDPNINQFNSYPEGVDPNTLCRRNEPTQSSNGEHVSCYILSLLGYSHVPTGCSNTIDRKKLNTFSREREKRIMKNKEAGTCECELNLVKY